MKRGRLSWFERLTDTQQRAVTAAIDPGVESARDIFDRLNLQRFTRRRTFRTFVTARRRERAARRGPRLVRPPAEPGESYSARLQRMRESAVAAIQEQIDRGDVKLYELNGTMRMLTGVDELEIERRADERAAELHQRKLTELRAQQEKGLGELEQSNRLTAEQVAEIRLKVLGL
jgi:hypothetical protein